MTGIFNKIQQLDSTTIYYNLTNLTNTMFASFLASMKLVMGGCLDKESRMITDESIDTIDTHNIVIIDNTRSITDSKQAIIYCRVSTPQQSLAAQEYACKVYCREKGYEVINVITEVGSAYTGGSQPKLKKLITESKDVNLVIYKLDRFSRNSGTCSLMVDTMLANKINLECITDPINLSSSLGKLKFRESILKAQFESEQIAERVNSYHRYRRENNIKILRPTYGYALSDDKKSIVKIQKEQEVINFIVANIQSKKDSKEITEVLFKLMKAIGSPKEYFVPVEIGDDKDDSPYWETHKIKLNARVIAELLNDYKIVKKGSPWNATKVLGVYKRSFDLKNLKI